MPPKIPSQSLKRSYPELEPVSEVNEKTIFKNRIDLLQRRIKHGAGISPTEQKELDFLLRYRKGTLSAEELQELRQITNQRRNPEPTAIKFNPDLAKLLSSEYARLEKKISKGDADAETLQEFEDIKAQIEKLKFPRHVTHYASYSTEKKQAIIEKSALYRKNQLGSLTPEEKLRLKQLKMITRVGAFTTEEYNQTPQEFFKGKIPEDDTPPSSIVKQEQTEETPSSAIKQEQTEETSDVLPPLSKRRFESIEYARERITRKYGDHVLSRNLTRHEISKLPDEQKKVRRAFFEKQGHQRRYPPVAPHLSSKPLRILNREDFDNIELDDVLKEQYDRLKAREERLVKQYGENVALNTLSTYQREQLGDEGMKERAKFMKSISEALKWRKFRSVRSDVRQLKQIQDEQHFMPDTATGNPKVPVASSEVLPSSSNRPDVGPPKSTEQARAIQPHSSYSHIPQHDIEELMKYLPEGPLDHQPIDITDYADPDAGTHPLGPDEMSPRDLLDFLKK